MQGFCGEGGGAQRRQGGDAVSSRQGSWQVTVGSESWVDRVEGCTESCLVCHGAAQGTKWVPGRQWGRGRVLAAGGRYLLHNITVAVAGSQVQWGVVTTVHHVDACSPHDEHVDHIGAALAAGPVQGAEAVVIPAETARTALLSSCSLPTASSPGLGRERRAERGRGRCRQHRSQAGIALCARTRATEAKGTG